MRLGRALPPVAVDLGLRVARPLVGFTGPYDSWEAAAEACDGYESIGVVDRYELEATSIAYDESAGTGGCLLSQRTARLAAAFLAATAASGSAATRGVRVLDFGGAVGKHMVELKSVPGVRVSEWVVVESAAVARRLQRFSTDVIRWSHAASPAELSSEGAFDIVLASSVLQYMPAPLSWLRVLAELAPSLIIDRLPLIEASADFVMRQNARYGGRRVTYPAWFFARDAFLENLDVAKMQVAMEWEVPEDRPVILGRRQSNVGLLLTRDNRDALLDVGDCPER